MFTVYAICVLRNKNNMFGTYVVNKKTFIQPVP